MDVGINAFYLDTGKCHIDSACLCRRKSVLRINKAEMRYHKAVRSYRR